MGKIERLEGVRTIADGIAVKEPGIHTFDLCQQYVDEIVSVTDDEISTAILALIEQHKLIAEGAGAVAVAAAMFNKVPIKGKKVICLISGGNIDVNILSRVIGRGFAEIRPLLFHDDRIGRQTRTITACIRNHRLYRCQRSIRIPRACQPYG